MNRQGISIFLFSLFLTFTLIDNASGSIKEDKEGFNLGSLHALNMPFIVNEGQVNEEVEFYAKTFGGTVFITKKGEIVYSILGNSSELKFHNPKSKIQNLQSMVALREALIGSVVREVKGEAEAITRVNYFKGDDPSRWKGELPTYKAVSLGEVYEGVKLELRAYGDNVEKLFYIKEGAKPESIRLSIEGAKGLGINEHGELEVETDLGVLRFTRPSAYQEIDGRKVNVTVAYDIFFSSPFYISPSYGFKVGEYDRTKLLIIDPLLSSTFVGGGNSDIANAVAIDSSGNVFITGYTLSSTYPTTAGAYDPTYNADYDIFVSKLDKNLGRLLSSTYIGGNGLTVCENDYANAIAIDQLGNVFIAGYSCSSRYPTTIGAYDTTYWASSDVIVSKLSNNLSTLLASTYINGEGADYATAIAISPSGEVFVAGYTDSSFYAVTQGAYDTSHNGGSRDGFVSKLDSNLNTLQSSTYIGGNDDDYISAINIPLIEGEGQRVFITGYTFSADYPTTLGAYDRSCGTDASCNFNGMWDYADVFVSKLNSSLSTLLSSTFIGGGANDYASSIAADSSGNVFITGYTSSNNYPTTQGAYDTSYNGGGLDGFVSRLDSNLSILQSSTYIGGSDWDYAYSIATDSMRNVFITGYTESANYPTTSGAYDTSYNGLEDVFVSKLDENLRKLLASTYIGGSVNDRASSIAIDSLGNVFIAGYTESTAYPTTLGAYDVTHNGNNDVFISKLSSDLLLSRMAVYSSDLSGDGISDVVIFRPSDGRWYIYGGATVQWGTSGDIPVSGYYDNNATADISVWRPSNGTWYIRFSDISTYSIQWGTSGDIPLPGNYGGDGRTDFAVWRPSNSTWYIRTVEGTISSYQWGTSGDIPVPGDYNGDGITDIAVYRPSEGNWYIRGIGTYQWGASGDIPVPGDYNNDGITDIAVWRPSEGNWYLRGIATYQWGTSGDIPVPGDYNSGGTDIAVWRPSDGNWYLRGIAIYQWGTAGDISLGE